MSNSQAYRPDCGIFHLITKFWAHSCASAPHFPEVQGHVGVHSTTCCEGTSRSLSVVKVQTMFFFKKFVNHFFKFVKRFFRSKKFVNHFFKFVNTFQSPRAETLPPVPEHYPPCRSATPCAGTLRLCRDITSAPGHYPRARTLAPALTTAPAPALTLLFATCSFRGRWHCSPASASPPS